MSHSLVLKVIRFLVSLSNPMVLKVSWCFKWSTFRCSKWSPNPWHIRNPCWGTVATFDARGLRPNKNVVRSGAIFGKYWSIEVTFEVTCPSDLNGSWVASHGVHDRNLNRSLCWGGSPESSWSLQQGAQIQRGWGASGRLIEWELLISFGEAKTLDESEDSFVLAEGRATFPSWQCTFFAMRHWKNWGRDRQRIRRGLVEWTYSSCSDLLAIPWVFCKSHVIFFPNL